VQYSPLLPRNARPGYFKPVVADHSLKPAKDLRLGNLLHHQQPNPYEASPSTHDDWNFLPLLTNLFMVSSFYLLLMDKFLIFTHPDADFHNFFYCFFSNLHV
jgi:hypothetical protein